MHGRATSTPESHVRRAARLEKKRRPSLVAASRLGTSDEREHTREGTGRRRDWGGGERRRAASGVDAGREGAAGDTRERPPPAVGRRAHLGGRDRAERRRRRRARGGHHAGRDGGDEARGERRERNERDEECPWPMHGLRPVVRAARQGVRAEDGEVCLCASRSLVRRGAEDAPLV